MRSYPRYIYSFIYSSNPGEFNTLLNDLHDAEIFDQGVFRPPEMPQAIVMYAFVRREDRS